MTGLDDLRRDYRAAFLRYLPRREEAPLRAGYEIGRAAVVDGLSILDLAQVHHEVLLEVISTTRREELGDVASAASEFLVEVLATYDMAQRGLRPGP
ncbi:phosphatase RsbU N-terminal domain-containing protein [Microlunatus capsulatus]|uniref:Phosphoserine phosphatase RsbU N-terminal domain-containing protein n=1 Tax=Microlunatus capsulatus TaxID=99117 RepID=A0ABS4ZBG1_9ACTN|nr:phosphatase RsbU N-terminal domain-containing protein [Microlunatus capsulatus]MBP2418356.1 hypothetical protein [Microlunatus capsulatus]